MKANKSKRNRHTGRVNSFKANIIDNGKMVNPDKNSPYRYFSMIMPTGGATVVRTTLFGNTSRA